MKISLPSVSISEKKRGYVGRVAWCVTAALFLANCNEEKPSFKESSSTISNQSADGSAAPRNSLPDGGEGQIDVSGVPGIGAGTDQGAGSGLEGGDGVDSASSGNGAGAGMGSSADGSGSGSEGDVLLGSNGTSGGSTGGGSSSSGGTTTSGSTGGTTTSGTTTGGTTTSGTTTGGTTTSGSGGNGSEPPLGLGYRTVELTQKGAGKVDILWIVDTSGSMSEEQQGLAQNFNAMITALNDAGHDFQTAITTTDVCQDQIPLDLAERVCPVDYGGSAATHLRGAFVGDTGRKVLKKGDTDLITKFDQYTKQGVGGSGFEHGLKAAEMAIQKVQSGQNAPLIRPDAFLAVIVVSDEEDDGIGLGMLDAYNNHNFVAEGLTTFRYTADNFVSYLQGVKGAGKFSVSGIVATRDGNGNLCSSASSQPAEEGTQYIRAASLTGGMVQSICDTNWNSKLAQIGLDLDAQITQVVLPSKADPATIKVYVNGTLMNEWTYSQANHSVKFNTGFVPVEGSAIKVTYLEVI